MTTIVMTGGTSGIGKVALSNFLKIPNSRVFLGTRTKSISGAENINLDLTELKSVKLFVLKIKKRLRDNKINALVLNAGVSLTSNKFRTPDGFETTFAVNYLAHYLLIRLLLSKLADNSIIILTGSGTYDPAENTIIPPPRHADAKLLAHPELDPGCDKKSQIAGGRAYSSSKLCVVLNARALAVNPEIQKRKIKVIAYDPGFTPGTGLVRNYNPVIQFVWSIMNIPLIRSLSKKINNCKTAGITLTDLTLGKISLPEGKIYAALRKRKIIFPELSELANNDEIMNNLWNDSTKLVGL